MSTKTFARTLGLGALVLALGALTGCLKMNQTWKVEKSGKGTAVMNILLDMAKIEELQEMMKEMGGGGGEAPDPAKDMDPEELKKIASGNEKVRIVSVSTKKDAEKRTVTHEVKMEFDSLKDFFESGLSQGMTATLKKLENGNYELKTKMAGAGGPGGGDMLEGPEAEQQIEMMKAMLEPFIGGLEMGTNMVLPTAIVETNGEKISDNEVSWKLDFEGLAKGLTGGNTVVFKGEGLDWKPFTVTAEDMEKARKKALDKAKKDAAKAAEAPAPAVTPGD